MKELIAVVITLGLVALIVTQQAPKDTLQTLPELPSFALQEIETFVLHTKGKLKLKAKREGDKWLLLGSDTPGYLQGNVVSQLLHDLQSMQVKRVASRNPEQFSHFSVLDQHVVLKDKQDKVLLDVFVGKPATDLTNTYIRLAGIDMVMTVNKVLTWQIKRTKGAWLEQKDAAKDASTE